MIKIVINDSASSLSGILILPKDAISLGTQGLYHCDYLTRLVIPEKLEEILGSALQFNTSNFGFVMVDPDNTAFKTVNGILYNIDMTIIYKYPASKTESSFVIPNSVIEISGTTFMSNQYIKNITIPYGVRIIGGQAFGNCKGLTSIVLPNSVIEVGNYLFSNSSNLTSITLSDNLKHVGFAMVYGCNKLTKIYIPISVETMATKIYPEGYWSTFTGAPSTLKIYCGASSKPGGWSAYWRCYNAATTSTNYNLTTYWSYTRAQFNALN